MKILITGGCGFIGCNAAQRFLGRGDEVVILDNLSRAGTGENLRWLRAQGGKLTFVQGDIRDYAWLRSVAAEHADLDAVFHLAAQVAVTTSVKDPREDFEVNLLGTFNLLEAMRETYGERCRDKLLVYASTNKVYGGLEDVLVGERDGRYQFLELPGGVPEERALDFHSPYGCSKGGAEQYVIDYSRIYGFRSVALRQSCIYGYRQFGLEDQGWVAWFTIAAVTGQPITIYGDGKQVRDVLFIDDLVAAYELILQDIDLVSGKVYNIGGGAQHQLSLLELIAMLEAHLGKPIPTAYAGWRPGDQRVFVCDTGRIQRDLSWRPKRSVPEGVKLLFEWVRANQGLFTGPSSR